MIRHATLEDLPQVLQLHERVFGTRDSLRYPPLEISYRALLFNSTIGEPLPSLVSERDGTIEAFVGVIPRPLEWRGESISGAVSTRFMVDQGSQAALTAVQILRRLFKEPWTLIYADNANAPMQQLWCRAGGAWVPTRSLESTWYLRPAEYARQSSTGRGGLFGAISKAARHAAVVMDAIAASIGWGPVAPPGSHHLQQCNDASVLARLHHDDAQRFALRHVLDTDELARRLDLLGRVVRHDRCVQSYVLNDSTAHPVAGAVCEVTQNGRTRILKAMANDDVSLGYLYVSLADELRSAGCTHLEGQFGAHAFGPLTVSRGVLRANTRRFLIQTRQSMLLRDMLGDDHNLERLDGEFC